LRMLPFRLVAGFRQKVHVAHQVARVEVFRIDPGIRSDSDLYTFGYRFKPWTSAPIATAAEILKYMSEVIDENGVAPHIRYRHQIRSASWSSTDNLWTVEAVRLDTGEEILFTANFLWMCQGYYRHAEGYTPEWPGMARFGGRIVHPQTWPGDLEYAGKNVVVIGSGATAATLIPAIAAECRHVTMLQRSPTFYRTRRNAIEIADELRELQIDETWIHEIVRRKILHDQAIFTHRSLTEPEVVKKRGYRHRRRGAASAYPSRDRAARLLPQCGRERCRRVSFP